MKHFQVSEPWARKMILLMLELSASDWKLPPEANEYYFQQTSNWRETRLSKSTSSTKSHVMRKWQLTSAATLWLVIQSHVFLISEYISYGSTTRIAPPLVSIQRSSDNLRPLTPSAYPFSNMRKAFCTLMQSVSRSWETDDLFPFPWSRLIDESYPVSSNSWWMRRQSEKNRRILFFLSGSFIWGFNRNDRLHFPILAIAVAVTIFAQFCLKSSRRETYLNLLSTFTNVTSRTNLCLFFLHELFTCNHTL